QHVDVAAGAADLLQVAESLFLDRGQTAGDVALGRLTVGKIVGLERLDDLVLIGLPDAVELLADLGRRRARLADVLGAGDLGGLAEDAGDALRDQLVVHVADGRAGAETGRRVALAALGRDPQVGDGALLTLLLG